VGDIQQLSPYVEDDYVSHYLDSECKDFDKDAHVAMTEVRKYMHRLPPYVMPTPILLLPEGAGLIEPEEEGWLYLEDTPPDSNDWYYRLNSATAVVAYDTPAMRQWLERHLDVPAKLIHFREQASFSKPFSVKQAYANKKKPEKGVDHHGFEQVLEKGKWSEAVCRLLNQQYMFRTKEDLRERADQEFEWLVPKEVQDKVLRAKYIAMPSILELLQRGTGAERQNEKGYDIQKFLWQGFARQEGIKEKKFQSLQYQHRMMEQIAQLPREQFYHGENLLTANTVATRPNPMQGYFGKEAPVVWVNAASRGDGEGYSKEEVEAIMRELESLHRYSGGKELEVAVLSFYRKQEKELREWLKKYTGQRNHYRNFDKGHLKITLCTVDQFQGDEADVVLLTFAKYTKGAFYNSPNRLNVALTRARFKLVLFGNREWLMKHKPSEAMQQLAEQHNARQSGTDSYTSKQQQR
jgi:hypothetical protein